MSCVSMVEDDWPKGTQGEFLAHSPDSSEFLRQGRVLVLYPGLTPAVPEHSIGLLLPPPPGSELHFASVTACDLQGPTCLRDMIRDQASSSIRALQELPPKSRVSFPTYHLHHVTLVFSKVFCYLLVPSTSRKHRQLGGGCEAAACRRTAVRMQTHHAPQ